MIKWWILRGLFVLPVVLFAGGWLWSGTHAGYIVYVHNGRVDQFQSKCGVVGWVFGDGMAPGGYWQGGVLPQKPPCYWPQRRYSQGFHWGLRYPDKTHYFGEVEVPYWFLLLASAGVLTWVWRMTGAKGKVGRGFPVEVGGRRAEV